MKKTTKNKITGLLSVAFGVFMIVYLIPNWVVLTDHVNHTSPDTFPILASAALIILGTALLITTFVAERRAADASENADKADMKKTVSLKQFLKSDTYCVLMTAFTILVYELLLERVGYIPTGCICSVLLLAAFRSKKWYHYVIAILFTFLLNFVFSNILMVRMP